jgi:ankyrin repeat protein
VRLILDAGADIDGTSAFNGTALQCAAEHADFKTVKFLVERGANVNAKAGFRGTALIAASKAGGLEIAHYLLRNHADPNAVDAVRFASPLSVAHNFAMLDLLLRHGADAKKKSRDSHALIKAVKRNDEASVALLLQYGADPNMPVSRTGSLICIAIENKYIGVLDLLLQAGANVNNHRGVLGPPILSAANANSKEAVGLLLSYGSEIPDFGNISDGNISPLLRIWHRAAKNHSYEDLDELKGDLSDAAATSFIRRLLFEWDIPHLKDEIGTSLGKQEVTLTTPSRDRYTKTGTKVSDYMRRKWNSLGIQILNDVEQVLSPERGFWLRNSYYQGKDVSVIYRLSAEKSSLSLDIGFAASEADLLCCIEALDWLCRAVRKPPRGLQREAFTSASKITISRLAQEEETPSSGVTGRQRADSTARPKRDNRLELQLEFSLKWKVVPQDTGRGGRLSPSNMAERYVLEEKEEEVPSSASPRAAGSESDSGGQRSPAQPSVRWNLRGR